MTKIEAKKEFIKIINSITYFGCATIFTDFVEFLAYEITNTAFRNPEDPIWQEREMRHNEIAAKYTLEDQGKFITLGNLVMTTLMKEKCDFLGEVYMELGIGDSSKGQYFTPYNVSLMMAQMTLDDVSEYSKEKPMSICEPACGSGGMVIAAADAVERAGMSSSDIIQVHAYDLSWTAVYMAYIQMSFLNIQGVVIQANTLLENPEAKDERYKFYTPATNPAWRALIKAYSEEIGILEAA